MKKNQPKKKPAPDPGAGEEVLAEPTPEEREDKWNLRPRTFAECIGQQAVVDALDIAIRAAKERGDPLDHTLFYGPPG
ncbi:MAG TPA: Holliday junction branch migration DNA helicase RuvB, partial [Armatimonadota bacterium]|nr:Holliday junction branch migration DNA helicase RuvB [Armatimonadota bacterium]